jgi:transposase
MQVHKISKKTQNGIRRRFIEGPFSSHGIAKEFGVSTATAWRYGKIFKQIQLEYPEKLKNLNFYIPDPKRPHVPTTLYLNLTAILPMLLSQETTEVLKPKNVYRRYLEVYPSGYSYSTFKQSMFRWISESVVPVKVKLLYQIPNDDLKIIQKWRNGNNLRSWKIATTLKLALEGYTVMEIMVRTGAFRKTVHQWLACYKTKGLPGFEIIKPTPQMVVDRMQERKDCLFKLIQESPSTHGLNRTSWTITALTEVYNKLYSDNKSIMAIAYCLKQMGYVYKKSRDILTSNDPNFREKVNKIQRILQKLKSNEKFFSIDEYGPVYVRLKHGKMLQHKSESPRGVPEKQKWRGKVICTAALELSTNQVTHFFSDKKNTFEMIKLLDMLVERYHDQERLFLCWDAVSWHKSGILKNYIEDHNKERKPEIRLAPLPSSTQYLNVIESVFGGLARAVIHNSDYPSVDDCKAAITLHFELRNKHFLESPKRAGKKIWGKEVVAPRFSGTQNCRKTSAMCSRSGTKKLLC